MSISSKKIVQINAPYLRVYSAIEELGIALQLNGHTAELSSIAGKLNSNLNVAGAINLFVEVMCFSKTELESSLEVKVEFEQGSDFMSYLTSLNKNEAERNCEKIIQAILNQIEEKSSIESDIEVLKPSFLKRKLLISYVFNSVIILASFLIIGYFFNTIRNK